MPIGLHKNISRLFVLTFFLFGCLPNFNLWGSSLQTTPLPSQTSTPFLEATQTLPPIVPVAETPTPLTHLIRRVLIVSFDGLRPDAIQLAPMDNLLALMQSGAYSLTAQTVLPSTTLPAHSSMLAGMCVARHHVIWDEYIPENGFANGVDLFDLAHAAGLRTVMIVGKEKLRQITEPESTDVFVAFDFTQFETPENEILPRAIQEVQNGFDVMFIHFPSADLMGHEYGWMSVEQLSTLHEADVKFGELLASLDANSLRASTLIMVSSDHGGHDTTHGYDIPEDMTIPWIVSGPGVQSLELTSSVQTMDTAATAAYALGLSIPDEWDGIPVNEVFGLPVNIGDAMECP
jgi:predicted AlkP superfamily pyrophosphatase or phosphodiesterase